MHAHMEGNHQDFSFKYLFKGEISIEILKKKKEKEVLQLYD